MTEIKIYGEIISTYAKQNGAKGVSLSDVQQMLEKAGGDDVKVRVNSVGGDVAEGFEIYHELRRYAQANNAKIHTFGEGIVASVATVIFLAGDVREISRSMEPFVHNAQWSAEGDNRVFEGAAKELERWNDRLAKHYSEHTNLSYDEARQLMNQEVYLSPEEALKIKFATKIEKVQRPTIIAKHLKPNINMSNPVKTIIKAIADAINGVKAKVILTADMRELDFYELDENETPQIGDRALINGEEPEDDTPIHGADGLTYIFKSGQLAEKLEPEVEVEEEPEAESNDDEITALKEELAQMKEKYESVSAKLKEKSAIINKFKSLEGITVDKTTVERPLTNKSNQPVKGARAKAAVENWLKNQKK